MRGLFGTYVRCLVSTLEVELIAYCIRGLQSTIKYELNIDS